MKKLLFTVFTAALALCCTAAEKSPQKKAPALKKVTALRLQKNFFLPPKIYAVPGMEINIYFRNIFLTINHANYIFHAKSPVGRTELKRWTFIPKAADAGKSFSLKIQIYDMEGLAAEGETTLHISPADAGKGKTLSILMVGDSLTNHSVYPEQLYMHCKKNGPALTMIGTRGIQGKARHPWGWHYATDPVPGGVAHEGYGGWTWNAFQRVYAKDERYNKLTPAQKVKARSQFLTLKNGKVQLDIPGYFQRRNQGKAPDVITFQLGVNDIFTATDATRDKKIQEILQNASTLIAAFRKAAPEAVIGVGFVTPGSNQDSFGHGYKCVYTSWDYYCNHFRLNQAMAKYFARCKDPKFYMIPTNVNLDTENNFPVQKVPANQHNKDRVIRQCNGVHPAVSGYRQMGDTFYAWLKYLTAHPMK